MKNRSRALGIDICPRANVSTTPATNTTCKMGTKLQKNAPSRRSGIISRPATVNETNAPKASATNIGLCSDNWNPPLSGPATSCRYVTSGRNIIRTSSDQPFIIDACQPPYMIIGVLPLNSVWQRRLVGSELNIVMFELV